MCNTDNNILIKTSFELQDRPLLPMEKHLSKSIIYSIKKSTIKGTLQDAKVVHEQEKRKETSLQGVDCKEREPVWGIDEKIKTKCTHSQDKKKSCRDAYHFFSSDFTRKHIQLFQKTHFTVPKGSRTAYAMRRTWYECTYTRKSHKWINWFLQQSPSQVLEVNEWNFLFRR